MPDDLSTTRDLDRAGDRSGRGRSTDGSTGRRTRSGRAGRAGCAGGAFGPADTARWAWRQLDEHADGALPAHAPRGREPSPGRWCRNAASTRPPVTRYVADNPEVSPWLERLGLFDVYASPWFSAIYLLLFVSLIGCVVPRSRVHWQALRSRPPRTPARLERMPCPPASGGRRRARNRARGGAPRAPGPSLQGGPASGGARSGHRVGQRRARLPPGDGQPRVPPRAGRAAGGGRAGFAARLPGADDPHDRDGIRQQPQSVRHVRPRDLGRPGDAAAVPVHARRPRREVRDRGRGEPVRSTTRLHRGRHRRARARRRAPGADRPRQRAAVAVRAPTSTCKATATRPC